jgi:DNA damage-binding protein 1
MDMVAPGMSDVTYEEDTDYGAIPFSCPGARRILPIPTDGAEKKAIIIGDEYTVLYSFGPVTPHARDPGSSPMSSPRASAVNRSPQAEMKQLGKRRKSSIGGEGGLRWELKPVWRIRQGFGTVLA